jgi:lariat debranching enzyme
MAGPEYLLSRSRRLRPGKRRQDCRCFWYLQISRLYHGYFLCLRCCDCPLNLWKGHPERVPYNRGSMRSIYHTREFDVRRLSLVRPRSSLPFKPYSIETIKLTGPAIFLSHDWPAGIEHFGNIQALMRRKPHFRSDSAKGELGSPPYMGLLKTLRPQWWFSAHLHVRFEAEVVHEGGGPPTAPTPVVAANPDEIAIDEDDEALDQPQAGATSQKETASANPDEITLDEEEDEVAPPPPPPPPPPPSSKTRFLALDKCLPKRQFLEVRGLDSAFPAGASPIDLQVVDVPTPKEYANAPVDISLDSEWLAITRAFHYLFSTTSHQPPFPPPEEAWQRVKESYDWVQTNAGKNFADAKRWLVSDVQKFTAVAPGGPMSPAPKGQQRTSSRLSIDANGD